MKSVEIGLITIYPIMAITIYIVVLIVSSLILWSVDWPKIVKKENRTQFVVLGVYIIAVLSVTFLLGTFLILFSGIIGALF